MKDHIHILELASRNALPQVIDRKSEISFRAACELLDAGHLSGLSAQSINGSSIVKPAITLSGRAYLAEQRKQLGLAGWLRRSYSFLKPLFGWVASIVAAVMVAYLVKQFIEK